MYSGYRIAFVELSSWSFVNGIARNFIIFGVDISSSSHTDNWKKNFLVLGEEPTDDINGNMGVEDKYFNVNFNKAKTRFCFWVCIKTVILVIFLLTKKKSISLKQIINMSTFYFNFV